MKLPGLAACTPRKVGTEESHRGEEIQWPREPQAEQILRQFTAPARNTPTCTALVGLGRAVESVLVARCLRSEALGREINDGLRVVENWNFAIPRCSPC